MIVDATTGRPKGFGFVRFGCEADRDRALAEMDGVCLGSRTIRVSAATARRHVSPATGPAGTSISSGGGSLGGGGGRTSYGGESMGGGPSSTAPHPADFDPTNTTLFIGGLSALVTEEQLHKIFAKYGEIIYTKVGWGACHGFGAGLRHTVLPDGHISVLPWSVRVGTVLWALMNNGRGVAEQLFLQYRGTPT